MKKTCIVAIAMVLLMAGSAFATLTPVSTPPAPSWWDVSQDFTKAGTLTYTNSLGGDNDWGTLDVMMVNSYNATYTKQVYLIVDWWITGGTAGQLAEPVNIYWPEHLTPVGMTKTQGPIDENGVTHLEYAYTISIQPAVEWFQFNYSGINVGETIHIAYKAETKCFPPPPPPATPEPGVLALVGVGMIGLVARKRRS